MRESHVPYLIAVDGGGTSCRFALQAGATRHELRLGSANVFSNRAGALATLIEGLARLVAQAGLPPDALADIPVFAGLAGVIDEVAAKEVAAALPLLRVEVADDRLPAVVGALGARTGCLIGVGTGSFLGRQDAQGIRLIGGYGWSLGDEASGCWLGMALLRRCLWALDGLEPAAPLVAAVGDRIGQGTSAIVRFSAQASPADYAALAPLVFQAADAGDPLGRALMRAGADYLARGLRALGWQPGEAICALGGVAGCYAPFLPDDMNDALAEPEGSALEGGLQLARRLAERNARGVV